MSKPRHRRSYARFGVRANATRAYSNGRRRALREFRLRRLQLADREAIQEMRAA